MARAVVITGLRRSGTTVFWETFRKDGGSVCYYEPFHRSPFGGRFTNGKGTWDELAEVWRREKLAERAGLAPILPVEELDPVSSAAQRDYLRTLMSQARPQAVGEGTGGCVIDTVRCWNRLPEILPGDIDTLVVHLLRDPASWVTSILLPSGGRSPGSGLAGLLRRIGFFRRHRFDNRWRYEEIIDAAIRRRHAVLGPLPLRPEELAGQPAYFRLLAFWLAANLETHRRLSAWSGGRVLTVSLAEFSADPAATIARVYEAAGWRLGPASLGYRHVGPYRGGWRTDSPGWRRAFERLALPMEFLESPALDGERMARLFSLYRAAAPRVQSAGAA